MSTKKTVARQRRYKVPTGRDYLAFHGIGIAVLLVLGALAALLDWPRLTFLAAGVGWGAIYTPIAVIVLHTRRESRPATRS